MADRTSANIFGRLLEKLASDPTDQHKQWARELWEESSNYDFHPRQMNADAALVILELAEPYGDDFQYLLRG